MGCHLWGHAESDTTEATQQQCSSLGFPDSSVGKESTYNAGNPSLMSELERSAGDGIVYPLQCSWASLVAQLVNNPLVMQETWVRSLDWEDPLEKGKATHSSILAWILAVQRTLKSLLQHHSPKASILLHSAFFTVQLSHPYMTTGKTIA